MEVKLYVPFGFIILLHRVFLMFELNRVFLVSRVTLEKRSRGVHPTSSDTPRCPSRAYSIGCAIWLVAWVRVYKRFSSVSFRILAGST